MLREKYEQSLKEFGSSACRVAYLALVDTPQQALSIGHLKEELDELIIAVAINDIPEIQDALLDMTPIMCALYYSCPKGRSLKTMQASLLMIKKYQHLVSTSALKRWVGSQHSRNRFQWNFEAISGCWETIADLASQFSFSYSSSQLLNCKS